jgi:hypothetical protein
MCWRKGWDSNPRGPSRALAVFKTAALNHSATLPIEEFQSVSFDPEQTQWEWTAALDPIILALLHVLIYVSG